MLSSLPCLSVPYALGTLSKQLCRALLVCLPSPQRTSFTRAQTVAVKVTTMFLELR